MDMMDIASLSTSMSQSKVLNQIGIKVLGNTLDTANQMAAGEIGMINNAPSPSLETSVNPAVGSNFDVSV